MHLDHYPESFSYLEVVANRKTALCEDVTRTGAAAGSLPMPKGLPRRFLMCLFIAVTSVFGSSVPQRCSDISFANVTQPLLSCFIVVSGNARGPTSLSLLAGMENRVTLAVPLPAVGLGGVSLWPHAQITTGPGNATSGNFFASESVASFWIAGNISIGPEAYFSIATFGAAYTIADVGYFVEPTALVTTVWIDLLLNRVAVSPLSMDDTTSRPVTFMVVAHATCVTGSTSLIKQIAVTRNCTAGVSGVAYPAVPRVMANAIGWSAIGISILLSAKTSSLILGPQRGLVLLELIQCRRSMFDNSPTYVNFLQISVDGGEGYAASSRGGLVIAFGTCAVAILISWAVERFKAMRRRANRAHVGVDWSTYRGGSNSSESSLQLTASSIAVAFVLIATQSLTAQSVELASDLDLDWRSSTGLDLFLSSISLLVCVVLWSRAVLALSFRHLARETVHPCTPSRLISFFQARTLWYPNDTSIQSVGYVNRFASLFMYHTHATRLFTVLEWGLGIFVFATLQGRVAHSVGSGDACETLLIVYACAVGFFLVLAGTTRAYQAHAMTAVVLACDGLGLIVGVFAATTQMSDRSSLEWIAVSRTIGGIVLQTWVYCSWELNVWGSRPAPAVYDTAVTAAPMTGERPCSTLQLESIATTRGDAGPKPLDFPAQDAYGEDWAIDRVRSQQVGHYHVSYEEDSDQHCEQELVCRNPVQNADPKDSCEDDDDEDEDEVDGLCSDDIAPCHWAQRSSTWMPLYEAEDEDDEQGDNSENGHVTKHGDWYREPNNNFGRTPLLRLPAPPRYHFRFDRDLRFVSQDEDEFERMKEFVEDLKPWEVLRQDCSPTDTCPAEEVAQGVVPIAAVNDESSVEQQGPELPTGDHSRRQKYLSHDVSIGGREDCQKQAQEAKREQELPTTGNIIAELLAHGMYTDAQSLIASEKVAAWRHSAEGLEGQHGDALEVEDRFLTFLRWQAMVADL